MEEEQKMVEKGDREEKMVEREEEMVDRRETVDKGGMVGRWRGEIEYKK